MKLIKPSEISSKIMSLIEESDEFVLLVSPYVNISKWYKLLRKLDSLKARKIPFSFVIRDDNSNLNSAYELDKLGYPYSSVRDLHAKLYLNEKYAIVSSLNLLLSSEINSIEIGYQIETEEEYAELKDFCKRFLSINFNFKAISIDNSFRGDWNLYLCNSISRNLNKRVSVRQEDGSMSITVGSMRFDCFIWSSKSNYLRLNCILSTKEYEAALNQKKYFSNLVDMKIDLQPSNGKYYSLIWGTSEQELQSHTVTNLIESEKALIAEKIISFVTTIYNFKMAI